MALNEHELDERSRAGASDGAAPSGPVSPELRASLLAEMARIDADPPPVMTHEELVEFLAPHLR